MRTFIIFAILCLLSWVGFAQTNVVQEGYYEMYDAEGVFMLNKSSEKEVLQEVYNYYITTGKKATYTSPNIRVDFDDDLFTTSDTIYIPNEQITYIDSISYVQTLLWEGEDMDVSKIELVLPIKEVDTILVTECFDDFNDKIWLWDSQETVWIPFKETGLVNVKVDSIPIWKKKYQNKYSLERTKHHDLAIRTYKELDMPFQFMYDSIVSITDTSVSLRIFANEDWWPMEYLDDQLWEDGSEHVPGYQDFDGFTTRRHTITFSDLLPNTDYTIMIKGFSRLRKEEDIIYYSVKTTE